MTPSAHTVSRTGRGSILRKTYTLEAQRWPSNTRGGLGLRQQGAAFLCPGEAISSHKLGRIRFPGAQTQRSQALGSIWGLHFREKAKLTSLNTLTCTRNLCTLVLGKVCQPKKFNKLPAVTEPVGVTAPCFPLPFHPHSDMLQSNLTPSKVGPWLSWNVAVD